jgi:thiol-disulfide isomerase/thioredoxin
MIIKKNILTNILLLFTVFLFAQERNYDNYFDSLFKKIKQDALGSKVKPFKAESSEGKWYSNENLTGKNTYLNFWFEECAPCIAEMGALNNLFSKYKENKEFQFLSFTYEKPEVVQRIIEKYKIQYPVFSISDELLRRLNINSGFPTNIIANSEGIIVYYNCGGAGNPKQAENSFINKIYPVLDSLLQNIKR